MSTPAAASRPPANFPKQAVVVIHGMGEQIPMDTIKGFVEAVWETDDSLTKNGMPQPKEVWSKPDLRTGSLELRRITTRQSTPNPPVFPQGARTDFYELYWADLSGGSTLSDIENWFFGILLRNPFKRIPRRLWIAWGLLWGFTVLVIYLALMGTIKPESKFFATLYPWMTMPPLNRFSELFGPIVAAVLAYLGNRVIVPTFGRVVRYTRAKPDNIAARKDIRERGLALLSALHDSSYERIIVVGHSLGSILGYDLISYFWASRPGSHTFALDDPDFPLLRAIETEGAELSAAPDDATKRDAFERARRNLARALRRRPKPPLRNGAVDPDKDTRWLITDFVTLGSPLTHCEFLLNTDRQDFEHHKDSRELPIAPPVTEALDPINETKARAAGFDLRLGNSLMSFPFELPSSTGGGPTEYWQMHHAAPFSVVRWTNIYDPTSFYFNGDIISGPLAHLYGPAVHDINLHKVNGSRSIGFTHLKYWSLGKLRAATGAVTTLRATLNLIGANDI